MDCDFVDASAAPMEGMDLPLAELLWGPNREQAGGRTRSRTRLDQGRLPVARSGLRRSSSVFSAARKCRDGERHQGPSPVAPQWSASEKAPGAEAHPAGALELLRMRVAALRADEDRASKTRRWLCRTVKERDAWIAQPLCWWRRRRDDAVRVSRRGECSVSGSDGQSTSDESGGGSHRWQGNTLGHSQRPPSCR